MLPAPSRVPLSVAFFLLIAFIILTSTGEAAGTRLQSIFHNSTNTNSYDINEDPLFLLRFHNTIPSTSAQITNSSITTATTTTQQISWYLNSAITTPLLLTTNYNTTQQPTFLWHGPSGTLTLPRPFNLTSTTTNLAPFILHAIAVTLALTSALILLLRTCSAGGRNTTARIFVRLTLLLSLVAATLGTVATAIQTHDAFQRRNQLHALGISSSQSGGEVVVQFGKALMAVLWSANVCAILAAGFVAIGLAVDNREKGYHRASLGQVTYTPEGSDEALVTSRGY